MDTVRTLGQTHRVRIVLYALGLAVGWLALSFALGTGATASHADDDAGRDGLLSSLVDTVEDAAGILPDDVTEPVATVVAKVEKVAAKTVAPIAETVDVVDKTKPVEKVTDAVSTTVEKTVSKVPVVGAVVDDVVDDLRVTDVVDAVGDVAGDVIAEVDSALDTAIDVIVSTPEVEAVSPVSPTDPPGPAASAGGPGTSASALGVPPTSSAIATAEVTSVPATWRAVDAASGPSTAAASAADAAGPGHPLLPGMLAPLTAAPPASLISSGSSGVFAAAGFVPSSDPPHAHNAWLRGNGNDDENAPPGPPTTPDVAPD